MIEYKACVIGVVYSVSDCINAGVGHKIDPVVDGGLWVHFKTKSFHQNHRETLLAHCWVERPGNQWAPCSNTFIRDTSIII